VILELSGERPGHHDRRLLALPRWVTRMPLDDARGRSQRWAEVGADAPSATGGVFLMPRARNRNFMRMEETFTLPPDSTPGYGGAKTVATVPRLAGRAARRREEVPKIALHASGGFAETAGSCDLSVGRKKGGELCCRGYHVVS